MARVRVGDMRRRQLISATIDSIHDVGFSATTLQSISRHAGVSTGLVAHYFKDKDGLLEATLRSLASDLSAAIVEKLRQAVTPRDRLAAVVAGLLAPEQFEPRIARVWLAFWGQVTHAPKLKRVQNIYEKRLLANLRHAFKQVLPAEQAEEQAIALAASPTELYVCTPPDDAASTRAAAQSSSGERQTL